MQVSNKKKVEEILEVSYEVCNEWEQAFMKSISTRVANDKPLTDNQQRCLDKIYGRACQSPF